MDDFLISDYEVRLEFPYEEISAYVGKEVPLPAIESDTGFLVKKWGIVNGQAPKLQVIYESEAYPSLCDEIQALGYQRFDYEYITAFLSEQGDYYFKVAEDYYIDGASLIKNGRLNFYFYNLEDSALNPLTSSEGE